MYFFLLNPNILFKCFVVDRSGSMTTMRSELVDGIINILNKLNKKCKDEDKHKEKHRDKENSNYKSNINNKSNYSTNSSRNNTNNTINTNHTWVPNEAPDLSLSIKS